MTADSNHGCSVEQRLQALEDVRGIEAVLCAYGEALDYGLSDRFVDLFVPTGVWMIRRQGVADRLYEGTEALRKFAEGHSHAPGRIHKHIFSNVKVDLAGDRAAASSYFVRLDASMIRDPGMPSLSDSYVFEMGRYEDEFLRCPDGRWRFAIRKVLSEDDRASRSYR